MVVFRLNLLKFDNEMHDGMIPSLSSYTLKQNSQRLYLCSRIATRDLTSNSLHAQFIIICTRPLRLSF